MYSNQRRNLHYASYRKILKELLEQFGGGLMTAEAIEDASAAVKKR